MTPSLRRFCLLLADSDEDGGIGRRPTRVLLGLDHQPAAIAGTAHKAGKRPEIDTAVAGHGEHAGAHALVEAAMVEAHLRHHGRWPRLLRRLA